MDVAQKILCKEINTGMDKFCSDGKAELSCLEKVNVFHIKIYKEVSDPSAWLDPAIISQLTAFAHKKLSEETENYKDLVVLDLASNKFTIATEFCTDWVHEENLQRYLLGKCANARFSGSKTLKVCVHFAAFLATDESLAGDENEKKHAEPLQNSAEECRHIREVSDN